MAERAVAGWTLREYAAVYAATSEGFPMDVVLEGEGITPGQWAEIDEAWGDAFSSDLQAGGALSDAFDLAMFEAQELYRRSVPPLDDDLRAWMLFVRAWSAAGDPVAFLRERSLGPNDLVRLHRRWSARLAEDAALQKEALAALQAEGEPPLPQPEPLELRSAARRRVDAATVTNGPEVPRPPSLRASFPASTTVANISPRPPPEPPTDDDSKTWVDGPLPAADTDEERTQAPSPASLDPFAAVPLPEGFAPPPVDTVVPADPSLTDELTLAQYAALCAELDVTPKDAMAIFVKYGVVNDERRARIDTLWRERLETRTATYAEWRQLYRHFHDHFMSLSKPRT
jgi:hypothetical protein